MGTPPDYVPISKGFTGPPVGSVRVTTFDLHTQVLISPGPQWIPGLAFSYETPHRSVQKTDAFLEYLDGVLDDYFDRWTSVVEELRYRRASAKGVRIFDQGQLRHVMLGWIVAFTVDMTKVSHGFENALSAGFDALPTSTPPFYIPVAMLEDHLMQNTTPNRYGIFTRSPYSGMPGTVHRPLTRVIEFLSPKEKGAL